MYKKCGEFRGGIFLCIVMFAIALGIPLDSIGYMQNEINADFLVRGDSYDSGGWTSSSYEIGSGVGYSYFFDPLYDEESPLDLLEFLIHPSSIYCSVGVNYWEFDDRFSETSQMFTVGGRYNFASDTGVSLLFSEKNTSRNRGSDYSTHIIDFSVDQYLGKNNRVKLGLNLERGDWFDFTGLYFDYTGAYGTRTRFLLDTQFGLGVKSYDGGDDSSVITTRLRMGPAWRKFSLVITPFDITHEEDDWGSWFEYAFRVSTRFWIGENIMLEPELSEYFASDDWMDSYGAQFLLNFKARF